MKKLVMVLILAVALAIGITDSPQANAAVSNWQKGISIQSRYNTDFASGSFRQSVDKAVASGVNNITLVIPVHQDSVTSSFVYTGNDTPTDAALQSGLSYIKSKGIASAIAIHDNPNDYQWRAFIDPYDKTSWFSSYGTLLNRYGQIAQSQGASQIVIATELSSLTKPENTSRWVGLIQSLRTKFSGSLTYSAQRSGYMTDAQTLGFWPYLDKIGLSAYYGMGNDGSVAALKAKWQSWDQQEVSVLAAKYNKPVIFTEVGYVSRDGALNDPGSAYQLGTPINTGLQANAYQALLEYWNTKSYMQGVFFWDWSSDPNAGGSNDGGYTPQNKPAEAVMKQWFVSSGTSTPPPTQPTTPPSPATTYNATSTSSTTTVNASTQTSVMVSSAAQYAGALVDIEIYDQNNQRIAQVFKENQTLTSNPTAFSVTWTPTSVGTFTVKAGVFTAGWQSNLYWNDSVVKVQVTATPSQTVPPSPPTTPPPVTPPVTPTPTPPAPSTPPAPTPLPTGISIWWPSDGSAVSGIQPFKAVVDGRDISSYDMFWQVDGGGLVKMDNGTDPIAHKISQVDLTNWKWSATKRYVINFVVKDKAGVTLSQKATTITVN